MKPIDQLLNKKKLLFVTGKGGIGKSLFTAALGWRAALNGRRVCIVESTAQDQIAPLFGQKPVGHKLTSIAPNLFVINLNALDNFRDYIVTLGLPKMFDKVFTQSVVHSFIQTIPGIAELTLLGRLFFFCELKKTPFDLVFFDAFATGHFLSLLTTPQAVLESGFVGPVIRETERVQRFLNDDAKTGILLVTTGEALVVTETLEFMQRLRQESAVALDAVFVNRVSPPLPAPASLREIAQRHPPLAPTLAYLARRREISEKGLQDIATGAARHLSGPVFAVPDYGGFSEPLAPEVIMNWLQAIQEYSGAKAS